MLHDWNAAKEYYINAGWLSGVTLKTTAERFNIPYQSLRRKAAAEKWRLIREWKSIDPDCETVEEYIQSYKQSLDNPINFKRVYKGGDRL